jgi:solute carrier family 25 oxoglutarate transporter 11
MFGAIAGCTATCFIQPIDMVKVRLQLSGEGGTTAIKNPFSMAKLILKEEGALAFYRGLSAGLLRQVTYGMARLGIFRTVSDALKEPGKPVSFSTSIIAGLAAGGLGSMLGTPADLALIRMQADSTLPVAQRRNYKGVFDALSQIIKKEGVLNLWKGNLPTVTRAMALNVGQLSTYDQAKTYFSRQFGPGNTANISASMVAGFFASFFSLPFDFVKTRIQKQKAGADGKLPYNGSIDCVIKTVKQEGPLAFYKGFSTFYIRIAPHAVITLLTLEALNKKAKSWGWQDPLKK